jgi:hypothetical protein
MWDNWFRRLNMKTKRFKQLTALLVCLAAFISNRLAFGEERPSPAWHTSSVPFRVLAITSNGSSLWAGGTDEAIAVSSDFGAHWQLKHRTPDGNLLLNVQFANEEFGYAAGTGGLILTTENGGESWVSHSAGSATVLQVSFSDPVHGLIRTPEALLFTADSGSTWSIVSPGDDAAILKTFPYTYSLAALDAEHMAVMLKQGSAQYEPQAFLVTSDGGKSWRVVNIPNVTLYSFLRAQGTYWAIGTEVIHKDKPGGGYAVPVALYSSDGIQWTHSISDLSACKMEMCVACTSKGCLSANGTITNVFGEKPSYWAFPSTSKLTPKWAATESAMCFVGSSLECTSLAGITKPGPAGDPVPANVAPVPLGSKPLQGPHCINCEFDHFLVDQKAQGIFTIKLSLDIARNGTVTEAAADGSPTPEIKSRIEQQAQQWIFEPYTKDGIRVNLKLNTRIQVSVVHPR